MSKFDGIWNGRYPTKKGYQYCCRQEEGEGGSGAVPYKSEMAVAN